jgi:hypothetical protein
MFRCHSQRWLVPVSKFCRKASGRVQAATVETDHRAIAAGEPEKPLRVPGGTDWGQKAQIPTVVAEKLHGVADKPAYTAGIPEVRLPYLDG